MFTDKSFHFEQQLEQIRDPQECTRKVVQGSSAEIPFTMKIFYDTTKDVKLEFKQQGTSFPIRQTTNQVMTFFTEEADQYEIHVEMNYDVAQERQIYIEFLSKNSITQSTQEKFEGTKYCATIFVNTVKPTPVPTKEEIFGESLDYIKQIPAMVIAFNANSQTGATSISYMWILLFAVVILSILTLIDSKTGKRRFDSRMRDFEDSIGEVNKMTVTMDHLVSVVTVPLNEIKRDIKTLIKTILQIPAIQEIVPEQKKENVLKRIIPSFRKKKEQQAGRLEVPKIEKKIEDDSKVEVTAKVIEEEEPKTEGDEVLEALQVTPEEIEEERRNVEPEPSGGFVIADGDEEQEPTKPVIENPMSHRPEYLVEMLKGIDFEEKHFKKGEVDKWTYNQLNTAYAWISDYRKWANTTNLEIPEKFANQQETAEHVIYYAIFALLDRKLKNGK